MVPVAAPDPSTRYLRPPRPLVFPAGEMVPETRRHFGIRTALFQVLEASVGGFGCGRSRRRRSQRRFGKVSLKLTHYLFSLHNVSYTI
jgi:hypothetical protein